VGADFDRVASDYSRQVDGALGCCWQPQDFFLDVKAQQLAETLERHSGESPAVRALEMGCGPGLMLRRLQHRVARLWGIDASLACLAQAGDARAGSRLVAADGRRAPFAGGSFDLVFAVCVLHHVPPEGRDAFMGEMARLVRPGGLVAIWEHNPRNPLTRRVVARCPFDRDAVLLSVGETRRLLRRAGLSRIRSSYGLFFPWRGSGWRRAERLLAQVPLGAQFFASGIKA
jgi:SAM-dependent methyltransferase